MRLIILFLHQVVRFEQQLDRVPGGVTRKVSKKAGLNFWKSDRFVGLLAGRVLFVPGTGGLLPACLATTEQDA